MWAAWQDSAEELASQAASTLLGLGMLVPEGGAQELEQWRATYGRDALPGALARLERAESRVAELEAGQENPLAFAEKLDAKSLDNFLIALASATEHEPQDAAIARIHELIASYRKEGVASVCRCGEPGVDPYVCEADDCTYDFPELNPFGGGPVQGHDAKVSRKCSLCGWHTSVWHVDDGSAEEELHGHIVRAHGSSEAGDAR